MNAKQELLNHIAGRRVQYVYINMYNPNDEDNLSDLNAFEPICGTLEEVLPKLDFEYDNGFGLQEMFGHIWYEDGTWSDRVEYDGAEGWKHRVRPEIPGHRSVVA